MESSIRYAAQEMLEGFEYDMRNADNSAMRVLLDLANAWSLARASVEIEKAAT